MESIIDITSVSDQTCTISTEMKQFDARAPSFRIRNLDEFERLAAGKGKDYFKKEQILQFPSQKSNDDETDPVVKGVNNTNKSENEKSKSTFQKQNKRQGFILNNPQSLTKSETTMSMVQKRRLMSPIHI